MPHILLIDDSPDYCQFLKDKGKMAGFGIVFYHNLEDGLNALKASRKFKAVILDGRCFLEPGQQGEARSNFVTHAIRQLADIENEYNRSIPFCVNSEHPGDFREDLDGIAPVFSKQDQPEALFEWLKQAIAALPESALREQHARVFNLMELHLPEEDPEILMDILLNQSHSDQPSVVASLALLRRLLESLADKACEIRLLRKPGEFRYGSGSRTRKILDSLHPGQLPGELYNAAILLYKTCSRFGNHTPPARSVTFIPGSYTLSRLAYTYMELVLFLLTPDSD